REDVRPVRQRAPHRAPSRGGPRRRRAQPPAHQGIRSRPQELRGACASKRSRGAPVVTAVNVVDQSGATTGEVVLSDAIFGGPINTDVMHQALIPQLPTARQGPHDTKPRTEVRGGGKKPWRQKGTGRARQGSIRSPQWRHGGVVFGPQPRSYVSSLNKKDRRPAFV